MVIAGVLVDENDADSLRSLGVKDSKLLPHRMRVSLYKRIISLVKKYEIMIVAASEIDRALESETMNLNWLEAHTSAKIINKLKPDRIIIDCPSNNIEKYKNYLLALLDNGEVEALVEHKADLNHVESAAASILAKVTRENEIDKMKKAVGDFGSGYLTDPKTLEFLEKNYEKHSYVFRKSWEPYKKKVSAIKQISLSSFDMENNKKQRVI